MCVSGRLSVGLIRCTGYVCQYGFYLTNFSFDKHKFLCIIQLYIHQGTNTQAVKLNRNFLLSIRRKGDKIFLPTTGSATHLYVASNQAEKS